jgi:hypothetical protein
LRLQAEATPDQFELVPTVSAGSGGLRQPRSRGYRGADYDFITVETVSGPKGEPLISLTLDTKRARSEVRGQRTQSRLLRELVSTAADDQNRDRQIGRTLFSLLIPPELEAFLAGSGALQIELDSDTAGIPWELLDVSIDGSASSLPWAIETKLLRKLRTATFRDRVVDADADASVLIVGEPECSDDYPRLRARGPRPWP